MKKYICILLLFTIIFTTTACTKNVKAIQPSIEEMTAICELSVMECQYHNVVKFKEEDAESFWIFWTKDKFFWIEYDAAITFGINVADVDITIDGTTINISLPMPEIQNYKVIENSLSYIADDDSAKLTVEDGQAALKVAKDDLINSIKDDQTLKSLATNKAKALLENYVEQITTLSGIEYQINWTLE